MEIADGVTLIEDLTTISPMVVAYISFVPLVLAIKLIAKEVLVWSFLSSQTWHMIEVYSTAALAFIGFLIFAMFVVPDNQLVLSDRCVFVTHKYVVSIESDANLAELAETYNVTATDGDNLFILTDKK